MGQAGFGVFDRSQRVAPPLQQLDVKLASEQEKETLERAVTLQKVPLQPALGLACPAANALRCAPLAAECQGVQGHGPGERSRCAPRAAAHRGRAYAAA